MTINIADKGFKLDAESLLLLNKNFQKIKHLLPHFNGLMSTNFFIKQNRKDEFEGWLRLTLPKKALYAHFKAETVSKCIHHGFDKLTRETKKYKDLHFKSRSQYPDHKSIRSSLGKAGEM